MCGLVGMAGFIGNPERRVLEDLLIMDQLRGYHSVGVATINYDGEPSLFKRAMNVVDYLDLKGWAGFSRKIDHVAIGHNRWATQGEVNSANAHPFIKGNITGAHNGTLRNQRLLDNHLEYEVDSENIFHHINKNGIKDCHNKLDGAFALTYWDEATRTLNIIRNSERPLFHCYSEDFKTIFWASERYMLMAALERNKIKFTPVFEFDTHTLYKYKIDTKYLKGEIGKPVIAKLEPYTKPVYYPPARVLTPAANSGKVSAISSTPAFLKGLGYTLDSKVEFMAESEDRGSFIKGYTLDENTIPVSVYVLSPTKRADMLAHNGFFTANGIVGFHNPTKDEPDGVVTLSVNHVKFEDFVSTEVTDTLIMDANNEYIPKEVFEKKFKRCEWCYDPLDIEQDPVIISDTEAVCYDCSGNQFIKDLQTSSYNNHY
jgi:hypothetical protein